MPLVVRNMQAFEQLRSKIAEAPYLLPVMAKLLAVAGMKQVADEFRESRDPYGKPWAPVFRNRKRERAARERRIRQGKGLRSDKPLIDTGRMRASVIGRSDGTTVRVSIPVEYASYHQQGTRRIARRQILPENDTGGLGPIWAAAFNDVAVQVLNNHFDKGG